MIMHLFVPIGDWLAVGTPGAILETPARGDGVCAVEAGPFCEGRRGKGPVACIESLPGVAIGHCPS